MKMGIKWKRCLLPIVFAFLSGGNLFAQKFTISGFVYDSDSSEPLIAASVNSGAQGTVTNNYGFYSISLPKRSLCSQTKEVKAFPSSRES